MTTTATSPNMDSLSRDEAVSAATSAGFSNVKTLTGWQPLNEWLAGAEPPFNMARFEFDQDGERFLDARRAWMSDSHPRGIWPLSRNPQGDVKP